MTTAYCFAAKQYLWTNSRFLRKQYLSEYTPTFIYYVRPTNVLCGWISIIEDLPTQKKTPDNSHVPQPKMSCSTRNSKARSPTAGTSFKAWLGQTSWEFEHLGEGCMLYFNSEAEKTSIIFVWKKKVGFLTVIQWNYGAPINGRKYMGRVIT